MSKMNLKKSFLVSLVLDRFGEDSKDETMIDSYIRAVIISKILTKRNLDISKQYLPIKFNFLKNQMINNVKSFVLEKEYTIIHNN